MQLKAFTDSSVLQHGGLIRRAAFRSDSKSLLVVMGMLATCGACHAASNDFALGIAAEQVALQHGASSRIAAYISVPKTALAVSQTAKTRNRDDVNKLNQTNPAEPLSGTFRLRMMFDKDVKVQVKSDANGGSTAQDDGSQVSLLEITTRDRKIVKCVQTSLNGIRMAQQPTCSTNGDDIKLVFADKKAAFSATMEAVLIPDAVGIYKGALLLRAVIIPSGKRIGELSLSRP